MPSFTIELTIHSNGSPSHESTMKTATLATTVLLFCASAAAISAQPGGDPDQDRTKPCNVVWTTPSHDATGSMPLGNGQMGINLWVEEDGDLRFYISRTDSLSEASRLLKVGSVRISSIRIRSMRESRSVRN